MKSLIGVDAVGPRDHRNQSARRQRFPDDPPPLFLAAVAMLAASSNLDLGSVPGQEAG